MPMAVTATAARGTRSAACPLAQATAYSGTVAAVPAVPGATGERPDPIQVASRREGDRSAVATLGRRRRLSRSSAESGASALMPFDPPDEVVIVRLGDAHGDDRPGLGFALL